MKSKKDAKNTEDQLLRIYDYAWNKRSNGGRRPDDILKKLDCCAKKSQFSLLCMMLQCLHQKQGGDKIKTCDQFLLENIQFNSATGTDSKGIIRGVTMGHGSICTKEPIEGRRRCAEHKGMKVNRKGGVPFIAVGMGSGTVADRHCDALEDQRLNRSRVANKPYACEHPNNEKFAPIWWSYLRRWFSCCKCQRKT